MGHDGPVRLAPALPQRVGTAGESLAEGATQEGVAVPACTLRSIRRTGVPRLALLAALFAPLRARGKEALQTREIPAVAEGPCDVFLSEPCRQKAALGVERPQGVEEGLAAPRPPWPVPATEEGEGLRFARARLGAVPSGEQAGEEALRSERDLVQLHLAAGLRRQGQARLQKWPAVASPVRAGSQSWPRK